MFEHSYQERYERAMRNNIYRTVSVLMYWRNREIL